MRFWGRLLAAAFGMAALVGAAQFGVVYGLNVLRLDREFVAGTDNDWNLQLTPENHHWRIRGRLQKDTRASRLAPSLGGG